MLEPPRIGDTGRQLGRRRLSASDSCRTLAVQEVATLARTVRIELRAEPEREQRIRYAAKLAGQSLTDFMLDAASERAEAVITSAHVTVVPADFFDALWEALDESP